MHLINLIKTLRGEKLDEKKSSRYPSGRGSYNRGKKNVVNSRKSRVKVYDTIKAALGKTKAGAKFSTKGSKRIYVTTDKGWGNDTAQRVSGRTAKGFTPGSSTPSAKWDSIVAHAKRTKKKHSAAGSTTETKKKRGEK